MISAPPIPSGANSAAPSADAFDAIVQAANPSHPNYAAWIEKFGGTTPRRAAVKDSDSNSHLEGNESPDRRRRRSGSHNGSRGANALPLNAIDQQEAAASSSNIRSRSHSLGGNERSPKIGTKGQDGETLLQERRASEEMARRRRRRRKREKEKERSVAPPIPPPRTTSHALTQLSPTMLPPASPTTYQMTPSSTSQSHSTYAESSRGHSSFAENYRPPIAPPRSPLRLSPNHTRTISAQMSSTSTLPGRHELAAANAATSARTSPVQGRFDAETPMRQSSKLPRSMEGADPEYLSARNADSPTQTISGHSISVSRKGSLRSVDFALPEEPPARGSLDNYNIRKSFDALVSPFRNVSKSSNRKMVVPKKEDSSKANAAATPILKSAIVDTSHQYTNPSPTAFVPPPARPLSRVVDEGEYRNTPAPPLPQPQSRQPLENAQEVPVHPLLVTTPSKANETGGLTEEGEDFHDAKSDEGGNGTSAEEKGHHSTGSTIKKRSKKKTLNQRSSTKALKGAAASDGIGSNGLVGFPRASRPREKKDSSASEGDVQDSVRKSLLVVREPDLVKNGGEERTAVPQFTDQHPLDPLATDMYEVDRQADSRSANQVAEQPQYAYAMPSAEAHWRERFDQYALPSPSNPSTGDHYKDDTASSPISSELLTTSESNTHKNGVRLDEFPQKTSSRTSSRGFASVMARMRRERATSISPLKGIPMNGDLESLEEKGPAAPFGLGIATPASEGPEMPQKRWRNRLASFSGKSPKSSKAVEEAWRTDYMDAPLPPMPPKAMKVLVARRPSAQTDVLGRDNNRPTLQEALSQGANNKRVAQTAPLASREFDKKTDSFTGKVGSPTIHKTLSPALLTNRGHEADEVVSFIGSEGDAEDKRMTWNSLNKIEMESNEGVEEAKTAPVNVHVTRPSMDAQSVWTESLQQREGDVPVTPPPPVRRSSFSRSRKLNNRASDGGLRKAVPPNLHLEAAPPLPRTPIRGQERSPVDQSPASRVSMDNRRPSWTRPFARPSIPQLGSASRGPSINLDRDSLPTDYQATSPLFPKESLSSPKMGKRLFSSVGGKGKSTLKGISSSDYSSPYQMSASRSELSLGGAAPGHGREQQYEEGGIQTATEDSFGRPKEAAKMLNYQMNNMAVSPSGSSSTNEQRPDNAFDKMLRESAMEDVARVKQIASRTAQAHSLRS
jgi:hypothetical protein